MWKDEYFPKPYESLGGDISVKLDLFNYATKAGATGVDTSNLAAKSDLARSKTESDRIDVDRLKTVPLE